MLTTAALLAISAAFPVVEPTYASKLKVSPAGTSPAPVTQLAWGKNGDLYGSSTGNSILRFRFDARRARLEYVGIGAAGVSGSGIGFYGSYLYASTFAGEIVRLGDTDGDGQFGEPGETRVAIVQNIPTGDHSVGQIVMAGKKLFVGIGIRTINGRDGEWTMGSGDDYGGAGFWGGGVGKSWGESAWGGTISVIDDVTAVPNLTNAANPTANATWGEDFVRNDGRPYTETRPNFFRVFAAGMRNPYGLARAKEGDIFFTSNFNRTDTNGDGTAGFGLHGDALDGDFRNDVHDQVFRLEPSGDYGYSNTNWRGKATILSQPWTSVKRSITFDNLYNNGPYAAYDPANPVGLGPHSSSNGCEFAYSSWIPSALRGRLFVARWTDTVWESSPGNGSLTYRDVVAVDVVTGDIKRVIRNFRQPLDVAVDPKTGHILVADYGTTKDGACPIYLISRAGPGRA